MMKDKKCFPCKIASLLVVIGAINWGLVGAFGFNLVSVLLGDGTISRVVYVLVGLSGVISVASCLGFCPGCKCCQGDNKSCKS